MLFLRFGLIHTVLIDFIEALGIINSKYKRVYSIELM